MIPNIIKVEIPTAIPNIAITALVKNHSCMNHLGPDITVFTFKMAVLIDRFWIYELKSSNFKFCN